MYNKNFTIFVGAKRNSGKGYEEYEGYKVIYFHNPPFSKAEQQRTDIK